MRLRSSRFRLVLVFSTTYFLGRGWGSGGTNLFVSNCPNVLQLESLKIVARPEAQARDNISFRAVSVTLRDVKQQQEVASFPCYSEDPDGSFSYSIQALDNIAFGWRIAGSAKNTNRINKNSQKSDDNGGNRW